MIQVILENLNPLIIEQLQILAQKHNRSLPEEITTKCELLIVLHDRFGRAEN
jgi:hypothetical protein